MSLAVLKARFPYMFDESKHIGVSVPHGWMPSFMKLCEDIDQLLGADKRGFHWTQVKEKFGAARWYWAMSNGSNRELVGKLIYEAEAQTHSQCIVCGAPGEVVHGGWSLVLCDEHRALKKAGKQLDIYPEED